MMLYYFQVIKANQKMEVLEQCHASVFGGGHFGRDKTLSKVSERFYWQGMVKDVKEYCQTCDKCQRANRLAHLHIRCGILLIYCMTLHFRKFDKVTAQLHPIPMRGEVWHTVGVDLIGPLPETCRGNKYIMTVSCLFSKWPEATALRDKGADGVAEFLFKCFMWRGCCHVRISDQGREFVNQV